MLNSYLLFDLKLIVLDSHVAALKPWHLLRGFPWLLGSGLFRGPTNECLRICAAKNGLLPEKGEKKKARKKMQDKVICSYSNFQGKAAIRVLLISPRIARRIIVVRTVVGCGLWATVNFSRTLAISNWVIDKNVSSIQLPLNPTYDEAGI